MAITPYLAMTAAEYKKSSNIPPKMAWMACHFSPYAAALSNMPGHLPDDAILIVNDVTPMHRHDPIRIAEQLRRCIANLNIHAVLLDFQRPNQDSMHDLISRLLEALPCPVAVSALYAADHPCPVFLPPCPPHTTLQNYIAPWQSREIWLEAALEESEILLTETGTNFRDNIPSSYHEGGFEDHNLHCHYKIETTQSQAKFTLWRTREDLKNLLDQAQEMGIQKTIGLYQELKEMEQ